jgi:hypothetical protein
MKSSVSQVKALIKKSLSNRVEQVKNRVPWIKDKVKELDQSTTDNKKI